MCEDCYLPGKQIKIECLDKSVSVRIDGNLLRIETTADDVWGNMKIRFCPMCGERLVKK